jgi:DNA-binding LytR/AlgR family response regulator
MSDLLKYLIVDDEEIDRLTIESEASGFSFLQKIAVCSHALEAFEFISRLKPDIVFADIEMPEMSGIELIRRLSGKVPAPVFITSHPEFAVDGYEIEAFDYLLKPVTKERFSRCALRLRDFFQLRKQIAGLEKENESGFIIIKEGYDKTKILTRDILYLEAMKDYTKIVTITGYHLVLYTLTGLNECLPADRFIRIHRSYIVNRGRITSTKGNKIFVASHELPVGKLYKNALDEIF